MFVVLLSTWGIWSKIFLLNVPASRVAGLALSASLVVHPFPKAHTFRQILVWENCLYFVNRV